MSTLCNALLTGYYGENITIHQLKAYKTLRYDGIAESWLSHAFTKVDAQKLYGSTNNYLLTQNRILGGPSKVK